jgi:hypothetical protein
VLETYERRGPGGHLAHRVDFAEIAVFEQHPSQTIANPDTLKAHPK